MYILICTTRCVNKFPKDIMELQYKINIDKVSNKFSLLVICEIFQTEFPNIHFVVLQ
jgi:hypothetical protein